MISEIAPGKGMRIVEISEIKTDIRQTAVVNFEYRAARVSLAVVISKNTTVKSGKL